MRCRLSGKVLEQQAMLTHYIQTAMHEVTYELLEDGTFHGEIPACKGVWSNATALSLPRRRARFLKKVDYPKAAVVAYLS